VKESHSEGCRPPVNSTQSASETNHHAGQQPRFGKVIHTLSSQKEVLAMAKSFSEQEGTELTRTEGILGGISALIIYGVGLGFLFYLIYQF